MEGFESKFFWLILNPFTCNYKFWLKHKCLNYYTLPWEIAPTLNWLIKIAKWLQNGLNDTTNKMIFFIYAECNFRHHNTSMLLESSSTKSVIIFCLKIHLICDVACFVKEVLIIHLFTALILTIVPTLKTKQCRCLLLRAFICFML